MGARSVLVVAELADGERSLLEQDCENCGLQVTWLTSTDMVAPKLISSKFESLVVHLQTPGAARACVEARNTLTRSRFPIMALTDRADDAAFHKAFRVGADDVIQIDASAQLSQRLASIARPSWKPTGRSRGEALIVDPDQGRADALGRLLKEAGYLVKSVRDNTAARLHFGRPSVRLVVTDAADKNIRELIIDGNRREWQPVWVVRTRPDKIDELSLALSGFQNAIAVNAYLSPSDVLYAANQLAVESEAQQPYLLYGTTVAFSTGPEWKEYGFTYRVDADALVVRTLALPPGSELTLELVPPGGDQPLVLQGRLTERRVLGQLQTETAPPGFSVELLAHSRELWRSAFRSAFQKRYGVAASSPVPSSAAVMQQASEAEVPARTSNPAAAESVLIGRVKLVSGGGSTSNEAVARSHALTLKSVVPKPETQNPTATEGLSTKPGVAPPSATTHDLKNRADSSDSAGAAPPSTTTSGSETGSELQATLLSAKSISVDEPYVPVLIEQTFKPDPSEPLPEEPLTELTINEEPQLPAASQTTAVPAHAPNSMVNESRPSDPAKQRSTVSVGRQRRSSQGAAGPSERPTFTHALADKPAKRRSVGVVIAALAVIAVIALGALMSWQRPEAPSASGLAGEASSEALAQQPTPKAAPENVHTATSSPLAAPPTAGSRDAAVPADPPMPVLDPAELPEHLGYLFVASSLDTQVFVQGKLLGNTNAYLTSFCGRRYIRLGSAPGYWKSQGVTYSIGCQRLNRLSIEPEPPK